MAKQKRLSRKEVAFLKEYLERQNSPRASLHDLEALVRKGAVEREEDPGPLPRSIRTALKRRGKKLLPPVSRRYKIGNPDTFEILYPIGYYPVELATTGGVNIHSYDPDNFYVMGTAGAAEAHEITSSGTQPAYKTAFASAGDAALDGSRARMDNSVMLGFYTGFAMGQSGKRYMLRIKSKITITFEWIEALSFGRKSWGEVAVDSTLVGWRDLQELARDDGPTRLLYGVSPRGNHRQGEVGIYHPGIQTRLTYHEITLPIVNPPNGHESVNIFEVVTFQADRHHRTDRCNAVVKGCCSWLPIEVRYFEY